MRTRHIFTPTFNETPADRAVRRGRLCHLDGMLLQVEHANAHSDPVPDSVITGLRLFGVHIAEPPLNGAEVMEVIFMLQNRYVRAPREMSWSRYERPALSAVVRAE